MKETKLFELVTGTEMKPWLSRNMLPNINTCENIYSNFSANLRVVSLKLLELTQFAWPNLSIYFNFLCAVPRDDVIESTRFLMRPPVIIPPWGHLLIIPPRVEQWSIPVWHEFWYFLFFVFSDCWIMQGKLTNSRYTQCQFKLKFGTLLKAYDVKYTENS